MARKINNLAEVKVYINGKEQALKDLDAMRAKAAELKKDIDKLNAQEIKLAEEPSKVGEYNNVRKERIQLENERKKLMKLIRESETLNRDIAEDLDRLADLPISRLNAIARTLNAIRNKLEPSTDPNGDFLSFLNDKINKTEETIKNKKGSIVEFKDIIDDLFNIDDSSLAKAEQRLRSLLAATDKDDVERIKQLKDELNKTVGEKNRRTTIAAQDVQAKVEGGNWKGTIEETQQAVKLQEEYRKLLKTTDAEGLKNVEDTIAGLNKKLEEFNKKQANETLGKNLMIAGTTEIKQSVDYLTKYRGTLQPLSKEWEAVGKKIEAGNARLKDLTDVSKYKTMTTQFSHLKDLSVNALSEQKKYWESVCDNAEQGTKAYDEAVKKLQAIDKLETGRKKDSASAVMTNLSGSSVAQIREAIKATTELRDAQKPGSKAWQEYGEQIKKANEYLESFDNKAKKAESMDILTKNLDISSTQEIKSSVDFLTKYRDTLKPLSAEWVKVNNAIEAGTAKLQEYTDKFKLQSMTSQFKQLDDLSKSALSDQKKYWQEMVDGAAAGSKELATYEARLKKVNEEEQNRTKAKAGKVMDNLSDYSVNEIKEAIKATEQLRNAQKPGSKAWQDYADQVKKATDYLDSFKNKAKVESMNAQFKELGKLSADALAEQKKYWQAMMNGAENGSKELEQYKKKLAEVTEEERKRTAASVKDVMANPAKYSVSEIQAAIKATEQLRDAQKPGSKEWETYANQVANAGKVLEGFKDKAKMEGMYAQFKRIRDLSKSALAEQKKYWQAVVEGTEKSNPKLKTYEDRLRRIVKEEKERAQETGRDLTKSILSGSWTGTIGESKEAIKVLKEYKDTLNTTDVSSIKRVDKAISELTNKTKIAEAGFKNTSEALSKMWKQTKHLGYGNWKGSIAELEEMRRKLIAIRDTQDKVLSAKDRDRLLKSLKNVDKEIAILKGDAIDINHILLHMKDTPLWKLEKAAEQLKQELRECSENTKDFADKAAQLRRVNKQVESLHKRFKETENVIVRTAKRLMAYVAVYGGFNYAKDKVIEMAKANLQLSDTFADVQKTTGLASNEMKELSKSVDSIDTRTSQQQLHELAAVAGQLGLKSQTDILGFVKASNMISVSLNELGSEGTASLMKIATLTGEASQGTEKALLSIGSAINELTANSAATAGPIADLMARMGGVASQAGLTSAQLAAIGATADALGQSMEITGTSMNKFVTTLMSSSDDIAYALNMDAKALRDMLNEGKTMEAMIAIFERMQGMGGMDQLAGVMKDLGSEGARMTQVLTALATNVDFLKGQVELSTEAYKEATSIQQEYNIKNENALALWQRLGNTLREQVVNSKAVSVLESISRAIFNLVNSILEGGRATRIFTSLVWGLTAALIAQRIAWVKNMNALKFAKGWQALMATIDALTASIHRNIVAMTTSTGRMGLWSRMVTSATMTWKRFLVVLRANWLTAIIASVAALAGWFVKLVTYTSELTRATARYRREVEEEKSQVDALFLSLQRTNKESNNRAKIIEQINRKYGDYLGFMLSEKDSADKLAAAHKLINSELEKRMALNLQSTLQGKAANTYAEKYEEETTDIERSIKGEGLFNSDKFKNLVNPAEVNAFVNKLVNDAVSNAIDTSGEFRKMGDLDMDKVMANIKVQLQDKFNTDKDKEIFRDAFSQQEGLGGMLFGQIKGNIENLLEARIDLMEDTFAAEEAAEVEMGRITQSAIKDREAMLEQIEKDYNELSKLDVSTKSESEQKEHYAQMLDNAQDYVDNATKILREIPESEREITNDQLNANITKYKEQVKVLAPLADVDPWGKSMNLDNWTTFADIIKNLDTASADSLVAAYKKLKEESAQIPSNVQKFYKMFEGTGLETTLKLKDPKDVAKTVHDWAEQIKVKLKEKYGRNTIGDFIFKDETGGKRQKDEFEAALASLEAYYNDREEIVRKNALLEEITQEELDKRLQSLEQEHLSARIELRKLMLSKENSFLTTFSHAAESEYMQGIDYNKLQTQLGKLGKSMSQGLEKKLTEDMVALQKIVWTHQEEISKILLENDPVQKTVSEYQKSFEKLDMLWSADEQRTKDAAREKMAILLEFSSKRASLSDKDMRKQLEESRQFSQVVKTMTAEEFQAFLILLDQYAEAATNAKRQATQKAVRSLEFGFDNSDIGRQVSGQLQNIEDIKGQLNEMQSSGLTMDGSALKKQKELVEQRIALEQLKWNTMIETEKNGMNRMEVLQNLMLEKDKKTYQARLEVMKLIMDMDAKMFDESGSRIDQMQGWGAISEIKATERKRDLINAELALQQMRIDEMIRIEEEGQNRMEVIENLRMARKDALYKADRRLTELTMQEYQQRTQAANEWGTAIGNGLGEMIAGTEDAGKALVKNLATMAVQSIGQMAQMFVAKQLLLSQQNMAEAASAMTTATTAAAEATAVGAAKTAEATAIAMATPDSVLTFGASGAAKAAVISGLIAAAVAASIAIINSLFPGAGNKATSSNRKLSTGMLTYAEGNYPVLGNDGKVYDAKYEGAGMKTGIYGGGAHFGIFSEKQPEMIVDGKTTQKLILNYPYIYDAITTIAKNGRLVNAMPTFASGDYPAGMKQIAPIAAVDASAGVGNEQMERTNAVLEQATSVIRELSKVLTSGQISANVDPYANRKATQRAEKFMKRRGID